MIIIDYNFLDTFVKYSGYMSPEYAMDGLFSVKSDVFSFGVLLLETVSGKKNRGFYHSNNELNLLGHVSTQVINSSSKDYYLSLAIIFSYG